MRRYTPDYKTYYNADSRVWFGKNERYFYNCKLENLSRFGFINIWANNAVKKVTQIKRTMKGSFIYGEKVKQILISWVLSS